MDVIDQLQSLKPSTKESLEINAAKQGLQEDPEKLKHCLVGKLVSARIVNIEAFQNTMLRVWSFCRGLTIHKLSDNIFLINPQSVPRRDKILEESPWCFDRSLILFKTPSVFDLPEQMVFDDPLFWVQFHNVPIGLRNENMANTWESSRHGPEGRH